MLPALPVTLAMTVMPTWRPSLTCPHTCPEPSKTWIGACKGMHTVHVALGHGGWEDQWIPLKLVAPLRFPFELGAPDPSGGYVSTRV